jgi:hypothetical protein
MSSQQSVYTGFWTNWAEGQILGATLTLSARDGAYLVALLALFIRVTGGYLWLIICFALFRNSSTSTLNGLGHQQKAILRNSTSDSAALWQFLQSAWYWQRKSNLPVARSVRLALMAAIHITIFAAAGAFSSRVAVTDSQVLLVSANCGTWSFLSQIDNTASSSFEHDNLARAAKLASQCYNGTEVISSAECLLSGRRLVPWTLEKNATCPFDASLCFESQAVTLDSGYVDSLHNLGINSRPEDRVSYRQVSTCAPLDIRANHITGFQSGNASLLGPHFTSDATIQWQSLLLGPNYATGGNATFSFSNATINADARLIGSVGESQAYTVGYACFIARG